MHVERVHIVDYGPIEKLDIRLPVKGEFPKPVVLVGENGSGKSIVLSHIVNGLVLAKGIAYPGTPEVEAGHVYKFRSNTYIRNDSAFSYSNIGFENGFFVKEMRLAQPKQEDMSESLQASPSEIQEMWQRIQAKDFDLLTSNFARHKNDIRDIFDRSCVLYFPHNRFEEPAWLNENNLSNRANYMELSHLSGHTTRRIINYSPMRDNQNWLFDVIYDSRAFEMQTRTFLHDQDGPLRIFAGYQGSASQFHQFALTLVQLITGSRANRFGIGERHNRAVALHQGERRILPNIFQMSSGEVALLSLCMSILRDFDLTGKPFNFTNEIRGVVVVDEIDLHLHATHQKTILPRLIQMFPKVQFVVTTHSPLFVLGMSQIFGEDGFVLYRMPTGEQIEPEEFSEFESAYQSLIDTQKFREDMQKAIEHAQRPMIFVEGTTDVKYLQRAGELLGRQMFLDNIELREGNGSGNLTNIWKRASLLPDSVRHQKIVLLFDCDTQIERDETGKVFKRIMPFSDGNPIRKGIENLFEKSTLSKAIQANPSFIDIEKEHSKTERGKDVNVPEKWIVHKDEKPNLCDWLCKHGTRDDFQHFGRFSKCWRRYSRRVLRATSGVDPRPSLRRRFRGCEVGVVGEKASGAAATGREW